MPARRTVSVALEVKAAEARRQIRGSADDVRKLEGQVVAAGRGLDKMSDKAAKAGRGAEKAAAGTKIAKVEAEAYKRELGQLDRQIDATVLHLKALGREFVKTGDQAILSRIKAERSMLSQLRAIQRSNAGGGGDGPGIGAALGAIPAQLKGAGIVAALAILPTVLPIIGAAVGGAVLGGVGAGGVVGGIVAASQDGRVKDAWADVGEGLKAALRGVGQPIVGPLVHEMNTFAATAHRGIDILHDGFAELAPVIRPLALGLDGFVEAIGPGLTRAFAAARPALRVIANELPEIGRALTDMFDSIAEEGDGATMGLLAMLHALEWIIRAGGSFIGTMSGIFEWLVRTGNSFTEWGLKVLDVASALAVIGGAPLSASIDAARSHLTALNTETDHLISGLEKGKDSSKDFSYGVDGVADSAEEAAQKIRDLNDQIEEQLGIVLSVQEAHIRLERQWDETVEVLRDGKRTLDINTKAGQDNKEALLNMVRAADAVRLAEYKKTNSLDAANAAYDRQLEALRQLAHRLHFSKEQVDALIASVRSDTLKRGINVAVATPGLTLAQSRLDRVQATMNRLDGQVARATVLIQEQVREDARQYRRRWGGVTEHAAAGVLRDPAIYTTSNPARYAFAEPATGGEAFVPKRGPAGRAMAILNHAANWYGASVVPHSAAMRSAPVIVQVNVSAGAGAGQLAQALVGTLRTEIKHLGGDVQSALGSRTRVGG